ncbi:hypothetical protein OYC64_004049 [Pagothenia borchgrevinki]|uniref:Uncharacterized protein n=1 Tax=Pagothenia borchgrevinki TaxID=8213 RepID=A0ABD2FSH9_PAGBO
MSAQKVLSNIEDEKAKHEEVTCRCWITLRGRRRLLNTLHVPALRCRVEGSRRMVKEDRRMVKEDRRMVKEDGEGGQEDGEGGQEDGEGGQEDVTTGQSAI